MDIAQASNLILKDIPENERYNFTMHGGCYIYAKSLQILCDDITLYINKDRNHVIFKYNDKFMDYIKKYTDFELKCAEFREMTLEDERYAICKFFKAFGGRRASIRFLEKIKSVK